MKKINKITKENFNKKLLAVLLAGSISLGLSGCGEKNTMKPLLADTLLENAILTESDLGTMIVYIKYEKQSLTTYHEHYIDVVSGVTFSNSEKCTHLVNQIENVTKLGSITEYLTAEELIKASKNELTNEEIIGIITRIQSEEVEEEKILTK